RGHSIGGDYTTSVVVMVEHAPPGRCGLIGALACCGAVGGILLGSATGAILSATMTAEAMVQWGWRIPFFMGLAVGIAGYFLRRDIQETGQSSDGRSPFVEPVRKHGPLLARLAGLAVFNSVGFYLMFVYIVSWLQLADGIPPAKALEINTTSMIVLLPVMVLMGSLSDRFGRRPVLLAGTAFGFVGAVPFFWMMHHTHAGPVLLGQLGFVLAGGRSRATQPSIMVEAVPARIRCTAIALGYNATLGVVGGLSPLVATWLVQRTENELSPAFMVMAAAAISFLAVLKFKESNKAALEMASVAA